MKTQIATTPPKLPDVASIFASDEARQRIAQIAARTIDPDRMLRIVASAARGSPQLLKATPLSFLGAVMTAASLGLEPNTPLGHAHLVPFSSRVKEGGQWRDGPPEVQLIIGYRGMIELMRRNGAVRSIHADVVYEGDEFSFEHGTNRHLRHVPRGLSDVPVWAYAYAQLTTGDEFDVLPVSRVHAIRDGTQGWRQYQNALKSGRGGKEPAWATHFHEMAAKTMIRRLAKRLPMSPEIGRALEVDEERVDYARVTSAATPEDIDARLQVIDATNEPHEPPSSAPEPVSAPPAPDIEDGATALENEIANALLDARTPAQVEGIREIFADAIREAPESVRERIAGQVAARASETRGRS